MSLITSYESFCKALQEGRLLEKKQARLLLWLQNWIIEARGNQKEYYFDYNLDGFLRDKSSKAISNFEQDLLDMIIDESLASIQQIIKGNMRSRILRENVIMPIHKVRELSGYSMGWISRKSGDTIYEKIASSNNKVMAVQKRHTYDTLENRLFMEFLRELSNHLFTRLDTISTEELRSLKIYRGDKNRLSDSDILSEFSKLLTNPEYSEVKRWSNLPPNNTLLSARHYMKIWKLWGELKRLDERFEYDMILLGEHSANVFLLEVLSYINESKDIRLPQEPIDIDYENYTIRNGDLRFELLYKEKERFIISKEIRTDDGKSIVNLEMNKKNITIIFDNESIEVYDRSNLVSKHMISLEILREIIQYCVRYFGFIYFPKVICEKEYFDHIILDIFSVYPQFLYKETHFYLMSRLLYQDYNMKNIVGDEETYQISCENSSAIKMIDGITKTFSISEAIRKHSFDGIKRLLAIFNREVEVDTCHFVIPDIYNEFQLSKTLNIAANLQYKSIRKTPKSIGVAFRYQTFEEFKNFDIGNEVLVIVDLIDESLVITLLEATYNEMLNLALPYNGIVWGRCPRKIYSLSDMIDKMLEEVQNKGCLNVKQVYKIWGLDGLISDAEKLSIFYQNQEWFSFSKEIKEFILNLKLDISEYINIFLKDIQETIKDKKITIISLVDQLTYKGNIPVINMTKSDVLEGCKLLEEAEQILREKNVEVTLWRDYLEPLAIKRLIGQFDLLKQAEVVEPIFGVKVDFPISETFILHKDIQKHEFMLIRGNGAGKLNYSAVINLDRPLEHDVTCELQLTYEYGAENPYELIFIPIAEADRNAYKRFKVEWIPTDYSESKIQVDLSVVPKRWDELQMYASTRGFNVDVCDVISEEYFLPLAWEPFVCKFTNRTQIKNWCSDPKADLRDKFFNKYKELDRYKNNTLVDMGKLQHVISKEKFYKGAMFIVLLGIDSDMAENPNRSIVVSDFTVTKFDCDELCMNAEIDRLKREKNNKKYFNPYYTKWLFALFLGNRIIDTEAPKRLKQVFEQVKANWAVMYNNAGTKAQRRKLIRLISLAGKQIGEQYFIAVHKYLDTYKDDDYCTNQIPFKCISEIGCGLSDLSTIEEQKLLARIHEEVDALDVVGVLAKAIWHNQDFLAGICSNKYSINFDNLINTYMAEAIDYIHECVETKAYHNSDDIELDENNGIEINSAMVKNRMIICFEFILGVLRLKLKGDGSINMVLSFENEMLEKLIKDIEVLYKQGFVVKTYLDVGEVDKGEYQDLDPILFLILVLILGYDIKSDIHIGYNVENIQTEQE